MFIPPSSLPRDVTISVTFCPGAPVTSTAIDVDDPRLADDDSFLAAIDQSIERLTAYVRDYRAAIAAELQNTLPGMEA